MARIVVRSLFRIGVTILLASSVLFWLIHASGDPTQGFLPPGSSPEARDAVRERLGLDQPPGIQYLRFLGNTVTGDFGSSWRDHRPASEAVLARFPATLQLASAAMAIAVVLGIAFGVMSSTVSNRPLRFMVSFVQSVGLGLPVFWFGAMLMLAFAVRLRWLPSSGNDSWRSVILPAITLSAQPGSIIARLVAVNLTSIRRADWVRTAESKGLSPRTIVVRHMLPNVMSPVMAYIGLQMGFLVGGAVVAESLFAWPGVGNLALQAASQRDIPVLHAFVVYTSIAVIGVDALVTVLQRVIDPAASPVQHPGGSHALA